MAVITKDIQKCADEILKGNIVSFPTETVYGLGANIFNQDAIQKIFMFKERPNDNPLIVHIHSFNQLEELTSLSNEELKIVEKVTKILWPGPITLILPKSDLVNYSLTAGTEFVGLRIPDNQLALELLKICNVPIAAPSANKYCHVSPTTYNHVFDDFKDLPIHIINDNIYESTIGIESSIYKFEFEDKNIKLLRPGFITPDILQSLVPEFNIVNNFNESNTPGSHYKHYAINKETYLLTNKSKIPYNKNEVSFIDFGHEYKSYGFKFYHSMSLDCNYVEAMKNIYKILRDVENETTNYLIINLPEKKCDYYNVLYNRLIRCSSGNIINKTKKLN